MALSKDLTDVIGSGGTADGRPIAIAATSSPGTTLHTAPAGTTSTDHVWIDVANIDTADILLTIEFGGTSASDTIVQSIPARSGFIRMVDNGQIQGGLVIKAFAGTTNKINAKVRVARYTA